VETALLFPVLLIVLSGLVEFGFLLNEYMALQDAARNAARFAADGLFYQVDVDHNCATTRDFDRQTSCLVNQELAQERPLVKVEVANGHDDVLISAFSIVSSSGGGSVSARHPAAMGESGWSMALDTVGWKKRNQVSRFPTSAVEARLLGGAPSTGMVLVEIFYDYNQKLKLPWITAFVPDPYNLHAYAFMPLVSAEPTSTPMTP
jgi:hypothetical protein